MALTTPAERLQPCLFERLIDEQPENTQESRTERIMSLARYREGVLRDLGWLLNSSTHLPEEGLDEFPEVESSVFNFGKKGLSGVALAGLNPSDLEDEIARAIRVFEPRIVPETLVVRAVKEDGRKGRRRLAAYNSLVFEISGELWAQPFPEKLFVKTALDLENGTQVL